MSNTVNLITELCPEDRARLDKIIEALTAMAAHNCKGCVESATAYVARELKGQAPAQTPQDAPGAHEAPAPVEAQAREEAPTAQEKPQPAEAENVSLPWEDPAEASPFPDPPAEKVKPLPLSDLQNLIVALSRNGLKDKARDVIYTYGVTRASEIPEEKRAEVKEKLIDLIPGDKLAGILKMLNTQGG